MNLTDQMKLGIVLGTKMKFFAEGTATIPFVVIVKTALVLYLLISIVEIKTRKITTIPLTKITKTALVLPRLILTEAVT